MKDNQLEIEEEKLQDLVEACFLDDHGEERTKISRKSIRQAMHEIPLVKDLSSQVIPPESESLEQQLFRHLENVPSGTINKTDLENSIMRTC